MVTKKIPAPKLKAADFVYMGQRRLADSSKLADKIQLLADGKLVGEPMLFPSVAKKRRLIGGIYTGASFDVNAGTSKGLDAAKWTCRRYEDVTLVASWEAISATDNIESRRMINEASATKRGELVKITLPLRRIYNDLRQRGDYIGAEAFLTGVSIFIKRRLSAEEE